MDPSWLPRNGSLNDAYRLLGTIGQAAVPAVRLTVLPQAGRPGLAADGSFVLSEFYIESEGGGHRFADAFATEELPGWPARTATDNDRRTGWALALARAGSRARRSLSMVRDKKFDSRQIQFVLRHDARTRSAESGASGSRLLRRVPHDARGAALLAALRRPVDRAQ
jgi:hypothetical protein